MSGCNGHRFRPSVDTVSQRRSEESADDSDEETRALRRPTSLFVERSVVNAELYRGFWIRASVALSSWLLRAKGDKWTETRVGGQHRTTGVIQCCYTGTLRG